VAALAGGRVVSRVPRPAAAAWIAALVLMLPTGIVLAAANGLDAASAFDALLFGGVMQGMATLGVLIARREPRNPIGWIFCAVPVLVAVSIATGTYAEWARDHHPGAPGAELADWTSSWPWVSGLVAYALLVPLLFPDGRPPGPRWRKILRADLAAIGVVAGLAAFTDSPPGPVIAATAALVAVLVAAGLASAVVRYRRAGATERLQIRECVFAAWAAFVGFFVISVLAPYEALYALDYALLPLSVGLAMLRYRLYDVDVIIRRTLVYTVLVAVLAAVYLGGVTLVGGLLRTVTGSSGTVAVTVSTLAVAGAFQPLRRRIQRMVDRRFFRSGYDAQAAVSGFSDRLREEIDLDALRQELLDVVVRAVHPAHSTLWIRPAAVEGRPPDPVTNPERRPGTTEVS
jgi:hypothetical protein